MNKDQTPMEGLAEYLLFQSKHLTESTEDRDQIRRWASEVEAARAQTAVKAEPEMWQWRFLQQSGQWSEWIECAEEYASRITALGDTETQIRCLYAAPSSAPAPGVDALRYDVLHEIAATFSLDYKAVCKCANGYLAALRGVTQQDSSGTDGEKGGA